MSHSESIAASKSTKRSHRLKSVHAEAMDSSSTQPKEPKYVKFRMFFEDRPFVDRYERGEEPVDVFIPVMHTNELWRANLLSIYREIPVNRLILGDAGCVDETLDIAREFPRVEIQDHRAYKSLGYSIRKLIESVETSWFVYLHSDVYLPDDWYDSMIRYQSKYDFFECRQRITGFMEDHLPDLEWRALSGSQMGRKKAFETVLPAIDDDYLYRSEDIVLADLIDRSGHRYGKVKDMWHYHQHMPRRSELKHLARKVTVSYNVEQTRAEQVRACDMQARALVKYMPPSHLWASHIRDHVNILVGLQETTWAKFMEWVAVQNSAWLPFLEQSQVGSLRQRLSAVKRSTRDLLRISVRLAKDLVKLALLPFGR